MYTYIVYVKKKTQLSNQNYPCKFCLKIHANFYSHSMQHNTLHQELLLLKRIIDIVFCQYFFLVYYCIGNFYSNILTVTILLYIYII